MSENGKERFILTKSYEIAYAIFRVAGTMQEKDFAERLRASGAGILEAGAVQDYVAARKSLQIVECLVKFSGDVCLMGAANADTLLREVYVLDAAVIERMNAAKESEINLTEIFSKPVSISSEQDEPATNEASNGTGNNDSTVHQVAAFVAPLRTEPSAVQNAANHLQASGISFIKSEIRQSAILGRIRQSGNCRLKDLQEVLPGCSERTIRYDVQSLLEQNLIERIGNGGPSVSYRMRQPQEQISQGIGG